MGGSDFYVAGFSARIAESIGDAANTAVIVLMPGKTDLLTIHAGAGGKTAPRWLLETVTDTAGAGAGAVPWKLDEYRLDLYRLGWKPGPALLAACLGQDIPAVAVETGADCSLFLDRLAGSFSKSYSPDNDNHYLVIRIGGKPHYVGEAVIAWIMILSSAFILFFLFFFSFLFGKKSEQHLRDLMHVWWLPILYFAVDAIALFCGQGIALFLGSLRFGNTDAWQLLPQAAFAAKILVSWFLITLVVSLNQLVRFPEDGFIYGYIASVVCMVDLFVFSAIDFSLAPLFLGVYIISFVAYHVEKPVAQGFSIAVMAVPFLPYFLALFSGAEGIGPLLSGADFWNFRIALFIMPFQLMLSRLFHAIGIFGIRSRFYLPRNLVIACACAIAGSAVLLFIPVWSPDRPLDVTIRQRITENGNTVTTEALAHPERFRPVPDASLAANPGLRDDASSIIRISSSSRKFLERQLVNLSVELAIPADNLGVSISAENGMSVYDAPEDFRLENGGQTSAFDIRIPDGAKSWNTVFSSDYSSVLTATVRLRTSENPWGLVIPADFVKSRYILEVTESAKLARPDGEQGTR